MSAFDFKKTEEKILHFWESQRIFAKSLAARSGGGKKNFVFFEGPPTANGLPHIGHFLTRVFKDLYGRYKTMRGFFVLRKAGWDTHGLPVELEVEKELGFKNKKDIERYGIARFNEKAKESVWKYKRQWEDMTRRMGFWIDLDHPYVTYESGYIESVWAIIRKIAEKKYLYRGHRVVPFCVRCGTPLSSHEVALGYRKVTDTSVVVKFRIKNNKVRSTNHNSLFEHRNSSLYILAWTTTPWTLPGNVALAVGKDIVYVVARQGHDRYILAKELADKVLGQPFVVEQEVRGADLVGLEYEPLFSIKELHSKASHRVYTADFVSTQEGTGVVHTAVMYGEDDYVLGTNVGLPKVHTVDEAGKFMGVSKDLDGRFVKDPATERLIIQKLKRKKALLKTEQHEHDYPFCWRCDTPLLYYAKNSWFIKMSAVNSQLLKNNGKINWVPSHIKEGRFGQWLKEGKDWTLSRERYWGTPLPAWECVKCDANRIVGAVQEMRDHALSSGNTYYVLRHGLSMRKEKTEMIVSSRLEQDTYNLVPEGIEAVRASLERFKVREEDIDVIYASPFKRTQETAAIAGQLLHRNIVTDDRLGEIHHGLNCEGKSHKLCSVKMGNRAFDQRDDEGESWNDVRVRLMEFMRDMEAKHRGKKILIVSHGDPLWLLDKMGSGKTVREIEDERGTDAGWYPQLAELKKLEWHPIPRDNQGELDLHRPFIDEIQFKCDRCGATMRRVPDVIDGWFDSGAMPYAQWHWPFENEKTFKEQFPADFIVEGIDQTRGWFYTLLAISTLLEKGPAYKNVIALGHTLDGQGQKMSKSKGNVVSPGDLMDRVGVDAVRWYFYTVNAPGDPKLFRREDVEGKLKGFIATLQNCMRFYELYQDSVPKTKPQASHLLDKWVLSRLHGVIDEATKTLDAYDPAAAARAIEKFIVEDFSNWWLRRSRKRRDALPLLRALLLDISRLTASFIPFVAEDIYMRLGGLGEEKQESVHLNDWPKFNKKLVDVKLEEVMRQAQEVVTAGLALRKNHHMKVRQPLQAITVTAAKKFEKDIEHLIKEELNVKEVCYQKEGEIILDLEITPILRAEGYARELMRQIQDMRKEAGYRFDERVYCRWYSEDAELSSAVEQWRDAIKEETVLSELVKLKHDKKKYNVEKEFEIESGRKIWVGIKKS